MVAELTDASTVVMSGPVAPAEKSTQNNVWEISLAIQGRDND